MWYNDSLKDKTNIQQNVVTFDDAKFNIIKCFFVTLPYFRLHIVLIYLHADLGDEVIHERPVRFSCELVPG